MTVGLSQVNLAHKWLNTLRAAGAAYGPITPYVKLHVGDPGASGASNAAVLSTARNAATLAAASSGSIGLQSNPAAWTAGAGSQEQISYVSVWDDASAGNFLWSAAITTPQNWNTGNTFTLTSLGISLTPIAA